MSTNIIERADGRFCAAIQHNGRRKFVYGHSEKQVRDKVRELEKTIITTNAIPNPGRRTLKDLLDAWLETAELRPKTIHGYQQTISHILPAIGNLKLAKVEPVTLQRLYAELGVGSKRNAYRAHLLLHKAFGLAVLWGWMSVNPCDRVAKPRYRPESKEVWSAEDLRLFLSETREHPYGPLWSLAACTGARLGELLALRWSDYGEAEGTITISSNLQYIDGRWVAGQPKTKAGARVVALPAESIAALHRQHRSQAENRLRAGLNWKESDLIFTSPHGKPVQQTWVQNAMQGECGRLGLTKQTPHGLRHWHASALLDGGVPLPEVSARLGHANSSVTLAVYSHVLKKDDSRAARVVDAVLAV
ncbi:MAG: site-specific integrase [Chloroflexota bacterium]